MVELDLEPTERLQALVAGLRSVPPLCSLPSIDEGSPTALLTIGAWREDGSTRPLRAEIRATSDVSVGFQHALGQAVVGADGRRAELVHGDPDRKLRRLVDGLEHSLRQARVDEQLAADAARLLASTDAEITTLRRAAMLHGLGTTAVPNSILDKRGLLTRAEFDRVKLHPMLTEQMLGRSPALAVLSPIAAAHHEKADGSGYHKGLQADATDRSVRVRAASNIYVGVTTERADRPAFSADDAATELRRLASRGCSSTTRPTPCSWRPATTIRVPRRPAGSSTPAGSPVARWRCCALRRRDSRRKRSPTADRLYISPKTADHHIQHVSTKIGISTRAAAALWAMQHDVVQRVGPIFDKRYDPDHTRCRRAVRIAVGILHPPPAPPRPRPLPSSGRKETPSTLVKRPFTRTSQRIPGMGTRCSGGRRKPSPTGSTRGMRPTSNA